MCSSGLRFVPVPPSYNGNGNLTGGGTFGYGYDSENRLTSAIEAGNSANYADDGRGRRKLKVENGAPAMRASVSGIVRRGGTAGWT